MKSCIKSLILSLLLAGLAPVARASIISPQLGGAVDPVGGEELDAEAAGSVSLVDFSALSNLVIQANWTGIGGMTGNTIDGDDVDVRIDHAPGFPASASSAQAYNSSGVGNGYRWTGTDGQQVTIRFGTYSGSFTADRTVSAAGLMLLNFGGAYPDVTITYFDSTNGVLSTQNFAGGADLQTSNGGDYFTGYTNSQEVIARITIDITRNSGDSDIGLDAVAYVQPTQVPSDQPLITMLGGISGGEPLELTWTSTAESAYLVQRATDLSGGDWTTIGTNIAATPPSNTFTNYTPSGTVEFYAVEAIPVPRLLDEDFEDGPGGFTATNHTTGTIWEHGDPNSFGFGGQSVTNGNGNSVNCWGTNISNPGYTVPGTDTSLISPIIDLTGVAAATLSFAEAMDIEAPNTAVVNILDDTTDTVIAAAIHTSTPDPNINATAWASVGPIALPPAALNRAVRIEFRFTESGGTDATYMGWFIDDVLLDAP